MRCSSTQSARSEDSPRSALVSTVVSNRPHAAVHNPLSPENNGCNGERAVKGGGLETAAHGEPRSAHSGASLKSRTTTTVWTSRLE